MAKKKTTKTYTKDGKTYSTSGSIPVGGTVTSFGSKSKDKEWGLSGSQAPAQPAVTTQAPKTTSPTASNAYTGPSIVDYLAKSGQPNSFSARAQMATKYGIQGYTGTASQNTQLLNILRTQQANTPEAPATTETPVTQEQPQEQAPVAQEGAVTPDAGMATPETGAITPEAPVSPDGAPVASTYAGSSVVDYLKSIGQDSGFPARAQMAKNYGIQSYAGTQAQNELLLSKLRSQMPSSGSSPVSGAVAGLAEAGTGGGQAVIDPVTGEQTGGASQFQTDVENILNDFGITPPSSLQSPQTSFSDTYKQVYESLGLGDIKAEYDDFSKQYADLQDEKGDKISEINNNPWYSEGVRVSKLRQLDEKYEMRESNLLGRIKMAESMYDNGRQDAQFVTSGIMDQYNKSQSLNQDIIMKAIDIAEKRSEAEMKLMDKSMSDIYGTGIIGEYNFAKENGYKGSFSQYQNEDANRKSKASGSGSLGGLFSSAQINSTVNSIAGSFDNEPLVKNFNMIKTAYDFVNSMSNQTQNPSDDQALVYSFAKVMDPDSVVREGEYATVQKYAQSWVKAYGKGVEQAINGTGFLSQTARENIKKTIKAKYNTSQSGYNNLYGQYEQRINKALSGQGNTLTDYRGGTTSKSSGGGFVGPYAPSYYSGKTSSGLSYTVEQ